MCGFGAPTLFHCAEGGGATPFALLDSESEAISIAARARGRTLKSLNQFAPDWIALGQLCLFLSELSPLGPYRVASALASITADVRAAAS